MPIYDCDIRNALIDNFSNIPCYCVSDTIVVNEFDVCRGSSRVDVAVINGQLHGYEIKSERDNLNRLPDQMESYNLVFDTMTIVVAKNHLEKVSEMVPKWWGIQYVSGNPNKLKLRTKREASPNKHVDSFFIAQLLWRNELLALLDSVPDIRHHYNSKSRRDLADLVAETFPLPLLAESVRETLKARKDWKSAPVVRQCDDSRSM